MASGPVCRTNTPNTWLHRPAMRREDFPCQPGAVHTCCLYDRYRGCCGPVYVQVDLARCTIPTARFFVFEPVCRFPHQCAELLWKPRRNLQ